MLSTLDGHDLSVGDKYWVVSFEENSEYIERSTPCFYKGSWVRDNKSLIDALPPGCSGSYIPMTEIVHHFEYIHHEDEGFNLLEYDIANIVIRDLSSIEEVTKLKLKTERTEE